jgi:hypothetical protein
VLETTRSLLGVDVKLREGESKQCKSCVGSFDVGSFGSYVDTSVITGCIAQKQTFLIGPNPAASRASTLISSVLTHSHVHSQTSR